MVDQGGGLLSKGGGRQRRGMGTRRVDPNSINDAKMSRNQRPKEEMETDI